jgi:DNA-directed RNA polymerase subunit alpha
MTTDHLIDLKALLVERPDCDAGTVQQLRNALAQGGGQYRALRDVTELLKKKLDSATGAQAKTWHLKIGIASFFLGYTQQAIEHLRQADTALAGFYLGRALMSRGTDERSEGRSGAFDEALKAFDKAEKAGYNTSQVRLQRAGIYRLKGDTADARKVLTGLHDLASHSAEYH